jgi:hypothetical protein
MRRGVGEGMCGETRGHPHGHGYAPSRMSQGCSVSEGLSMGAGLRYRQIDASPEEGSRVARGAVKGKAEGRGRRADGAEGRGARVPVALRKRVNRVRTPGQNPGYRN